MNKTEIFEKELLSVNTFRELASEDTRLVAELVEDVAKKLSAFYAADTLDSRLTQLLILLKCLSPHEHLPLIETLLNQCRAIQQLFLGARNRRDVSTLLDHRNSRLPFDPHFVRKPPKHSPLRQLQNALVDWQQELDSHTKLEKMHAIVSKFGCTPDQFLQLSDEEKLIVLGRTQKMVHLLKIGTTKTAKKEYRDQEKRLQIKDLSQQELELKRVYWMGGRFYQLHLEGENDDRHFKISYYSTENCIAQKVHFGEASFIVTISGDIYAEPEGIIGSRFDRNPFFAGRMAVNSSGILTFYNNQSECFAHDEFNLFCVTQYFHDLGLIGESNPNVICTLVGQREMLTTQTAFINYLRGFEQFPLWEANESISRLRDAAAHLSENTDLVELRELAVREQNESLQALHDQHQQSGTLPTWLERWAEDKVEWKEGVENPRHCFPPLFDNLSSDPLNLHSFFANKKRKGSSYSKCGLPAEEDRAAGICNDFHKKPSTEAAKISREKLRELRRNLRLKERLNVDYFQFELRTSRPKEAELEYGVIYFYPYHQSTAHCSYCFLLEPSNTTFIESQMRFDSNDKTQLARRKLKQVIKSLSTENPDDLSEKEVRQLLKIALHLRPHEKYLMMSPQELPLGSDLKMSVIKKSVQSKVSPEVAMAFFDDVRVNSRLMQLNYLQFNFGASNPADLTLPKTDHWDPHQPTDQDKKATAHHLK